MFCGELVVNGYLQLLEISNLVTPAAPWNLFCRGSGGNDVLESKSKRAMVYVYGVHTWIITYLVS